MISRPLGVLLFLIIQGINGAPTAILLNQKLCSFKASDYSLQWAYEPQSKNVVFVLKQTSEFNNFWTGVGFGDRKQGIIDFIGVFVKNGQIGIADTHILPEDGALTPDPSTNVQSIAFDYHNKTVTAKFARSLKSVDEKYDKSLDGCQVFNFAVNGGSISRSGIIPDFDEIAEKRICDIEKNCVVDIRQHLKPENAKSNSPAADSRIFSDSITKNDKTDGLASMVMYWVLYSPSLSLDVSPNAKKIAKPEFAESVDVSGTGDPCSFAGEGYTVNWTYVPRTQMVEFVMKHPIRMGKWWSAVGIGDTMADMDIAIMFISSGRPKRIRDYFSTSYTVPEEDKQQDWILSRQRTKSVDEMIELGFSRKLETEDNNKDRSLDGCVLFQFAANAGHYGNGFAVRKHEEWPDLYKACDITKHCVKEGATKDDSSKISESNDDDEVIDEKDDVDEAITLKKRTQSKNKEETKRQLENEAEDGSTMTTLIIDFKSGTSETDTVGVVTGGIDEVTTLSPNAIIEAVSEEAATLSSVAAELANDVSSLAPALAAITESDTVTTLASEAVTTPSSEVPTETAINTVENGATAEPASTTSSQVSSETLEGITEGVTSASTLPGADISTVEGGVTGEGALPTISQQTSTESTAVSGETSDVTTAAAEIAQISTETTKVVTGDEVISTVPVDPTSAANILVSNTTGTEETTNDATTLPPTTETTILTTTEFVTLEPVHIIPLGKNGELNATFDEESENRTSTETPTTASSLSTEANNTENNELFSGSTPSFSIQSTVQARPTTLTGEGEGITEAGSSPTSEVTAQETTSNPLSPDNGSSSSTLEHRFDTPLGSSNGTETTAATEDILSLGKNQVGTTPGLEGSTSDTSFENLLTTMKAEEISTPESVEILASEATTMSQEQKIVTGTPSGFFNLPTEETTAAGFNGTDPFEANKASETSEGTTLVGSIETTEEAEEATTPEPEEAVTEGAAKNGKQSRVDAVLGGLGLGNKTLAPVTFTTVSKVDEEASTVSTLSGEVTTEASETTIDSDANGSTVVIGQLPEISSTSGFPTTQNIKLVTGGDSTEAEAATTKLIDILTKSTHSFKDSIVTESSNVVEITTSLPTKASSPEPTTTVELETPEVEGSGEASPSEVSTTPIPGPFDHRQQLTNELGKEAVGNPKEGCGDDHEDYSQCTIYFKNYLDRVQEWANENKERMEDQYGKACTLLYQVRNVPILCCSIFVETCKGKIDFQ